jgi:hypothetical protein
VRGVYDETRAAAQIMYKFKLTYCAPPNFTLKNEFLRNLDVFL